MNFFRKPEYFLILEVFILLMVLSFLSEGYYGGADNINHYLLSRYSFLYPKLFLDPWGRPLYTILSSPFAQFGFPGIKVFNVILGTLSAWLVMKTAGKLKITTPWMAIIIVCFTPLYMIMLFTAMTEILFSFVLICSVYLFFSKRYIASAIVISFLPFARTEGYFLIPFLFLAFILRRQWKAIPFLASGFIFFSILGAYQYKDFLWIITHNPYPLIHPLYHQAGDFWTYIKQANLIFNTPNLVVLCLGIVMLIISLIKDRGEKRMLSVEIVLLALMPVVGYVFLHSFLLSKGLGGSLGFIRVMAAIIPLSAIITLYGFSLFSQIAGNRTWLRSIFIFIFISVMVFFNFTLFKIPVPLGKEEKVVKQAAVWLKKNFDPLPLIVYNDFNVPYFLGINPRGPGISMQTWTAESVKEIPNDALFIWDAHFGPNECKIPLDTVMRDPHMRLIKLFRPKEEFLTFGDYQYEVYVFKRVPTVNEFNNYFLTQSFIDEEDKDFNPVIRKVFDFEKDSPEVNSRIINTNAASGKNAFLMDSATQFSPGLFVTCRELPDLNTNIRVKTSVRLYTDVPFAKNPSMLVISLEDKTGSYCYKAVYLEKTSFASGKWNQVFLTADLPKIKSGTDMIKVYVWHPGKKDLILDDLMIDILARKNPE